MDPAGNLLGFVPPLNWQSIVWNYSTGNIVNVLEEAFLQQKDDNYLKNIINNFFNANNQDISSLRKFLTRILYISARARRFAFLEWLLNEKNLPLNCLSPGGKSVLSLSSEDGALFLDVVQNLIQLGAQTYLENSIYQPLVCCFRGKSFEPVFDYLLNVHQGPLNLYDPDTNETILMKLIKNSTLGDVDETSLIFRFCLKFIRRHDIQAFREYINYRRFQFYSTVELACLKGKYKLVRFLINNGAEIPYDGLLETQFSYARVFHFPENLFIQEKTYLTFYQFIQKLRIRRCKDWDLQPHENLKAIYDLPYNKLIIIRSCYKCCQEQMSHDIDSIRFFCEKEEKNRKVNLIQKLFRKKKRNLEYLSAIKIQRWWRTIHYSYKAVYYCSICREPNRPHLLGHSWYLLPCGHMFHTYCINKWKRACRTCRKICAFPQGRLGRLFDANTPQAPSPQ